VLIYATAWLEELIVEVLVRYSFVQMEMKLTDVDGMDGKQHLISSVVSNYVTYHVMKSSQQMWILDDFEHVRSYNTICL